MVEVVVVVVVVTMVVVVVVAVVVAAASAVFKISTNWQIKADVVTHPLQFRACGCGCGDAALKTQDYSCAVSSYTLQQSGGP